MVERTFELPDLGEGIAEGELVSWLVEEGESVVEDQVIAEVETDKALVEIPSPQEGTIAKLHYEEGTIVPVDEVIVTFEVADDGAGAESASATTADESDAAADAAGDEQSAAGDEPVDATAEADSSAETDGETAVASGRVFAAPSTRKLARELGVDISAVDGTGPGGRVTEGDVEAYAESDAAASGASETSEASATATGPTAEPDAAASAAPDAEPAGSAPTAAAQNGTAERDRTLAMPATRRLAEELGVDIDAVPASEEREGEPFVTPEDVRAFADRDAAATSASAVEASSRSAVDASTADAASTGGEPETAAAAGDGDLEDRPGERVPYRGVRRTIGEQMARSKYTAPHVSHHDEFDATELVDLRRDLAEIAEDDGVKLTYLPLVVKAITTALKEYPYLNSSLDEESEEIVLHDEYNIGIAVATDAGLMVPVVKNADQKGLKELADDIQDLAERARNRKIKPEEMQGGTFTITNIGVIGGEFSSPIINHPEAAIFAMGPIKERPWVVEGEVVARKTMRFSMSVDHRLVDGADAARFSNRVKELLVEPTRLLLE
ncbi:2-oxo acid dehydrogenase subunit E2 [Halobellus salinisoli]|uniref:2-oxo acid dehydrogenase subunit E2 n=1 Tax=Halobellus salinisoli TaxID=3108500 RepID=UPI00300A067E